jgi:hybrid cluster-associated redox disulfide protein
MKQKLNPAEDKLDAMIITTVLERWPQTAEVFYNHGMACVGCAVAPFFTIADAALVYGLDPAAFVDELWATIHANVESDKR